MSHDTRRKSSPAPVSVPPHTREVDANWDDDTVRLTKNPMLETDEDNAFERVTAVPGMPFEQFAKEVMAAAESDEESGVRDVEPEERSSDDKRRNDSVPAVLGGFFGAPAQEPRTAQHENGVAEPATARTATLPSALEPTGLELDIQSSRPIPPPAPPSDWHDPRDPVLELDLGALEAPTRPDPARLQGIKDRFAMGDFSGALELAQRLLATNPEDSDVRRYADRCRDTLVQMFAARLGPLDQIVNTAVPPDQIRWLSLDHRAGFLLSMVDGTSSIEQLLDICGMPRLDALRILHTLFEQRVIALSRR